MHEHASATLLRGRVESSASITSPPASAYSNTHLNSHVVGAADYAVHAAIRVLLALCRRFERGHFLRSANVSFVLLSVRMVRRLDVLFFPRNMSLGMVALIPWYARSLMKLSRAMSLHAVILRAGVKLSLLAVRGEPTCMHSVKAAPNNRLVDTLVPRQGPIMTRILARVPCRTWTLQLAYTAAAI